MKFLTESDLRRLAKVMAWAERQMGLDSAEGPPEALPGRTLPNIRGFLLQNVYSGGSGVMMLAKRLAVPNATQINIVGTNYVPQSSFKLTLMGTPKNVRNPAPQQVFTTLPISVVTKAADMSALLLLAAQTANLPVNASDFNVALGNPVPSADLVQLPDPKNQPEVDLTTSPPESYVGSWVIYLTGILTNLYTNLNFVILQDNTAFMRGLSAIVAKPMVDVPSNTPQIVWDVNNRPMDYPWTAGSLCVASHFVGIGYGLMNTDFRNQAISIPSS